MTAKNFFSLNHKSIGKSTQKHAHTAAAHVRYITRSKACAKVLAARMPEKQAKAMAWLMEQEDGDRKNARIADKVMVALPADLDADGQQAAVEAFTETITKGAASWIAAFHTKTGKDALNPHCHILIRDRDPVTGRRVAGLSERGSTDRLRQVWEECANAELAKAGSTERIDRRSLKDQGVNRQPDLHRGSAAEHMEKRGLRPVSKMVVVPNNPGARSSSRVVDYPSIDQGRTRLESSRLRRKSQEE